MGLPMASSLNIKQIRKEFPNLSVKIHGKPLVYLDNAATTLKPQVVIDAITEHYKTYTSNVHRGVHTLSERATEKFEHTRRKVKNFLGADDIKEIIFTKGTTESINLVAQSYGRAFLKPRDEIIISEMEHHSNIVPWQIICEQTGAVLKVAPMNDQGEIIWSEFEQYVTEKTKIVSVVYISNSLGTINPIQRIIDLAHKFNAVVLIDAAQAVSHRRINVKELDCDFLAFSGHKLFGPTGIGVLYGKEKLLESMPPYQGGGDMISSVTFEKTNYNTLPYKFEAGTPNVADVIGLNAAIDYVVSLGFDNIALHEQELLEYGTRSLSNIQGLRLIGTAKEKTSILSFILPNVHAHDVGTLVDEDGVAIRTGHHCTQPVMKHFNVPATSRASLSIYNTKEELDILTKALKRAKDIFA
jgi:cysteine desulfurase/selenocysteine lyase